MEFYDTGPQSRSHSPVRPRDRDFLFNLNCSPQPWVMAYDPAQKDAVRPAQQCLPVDVQLFINTRTALTILILQ